MDRWRSENPCSGVEELAKSLPAGIWLNLLVKDIDRSLRFQVEVLGMEKIYADDSFAIVQYAASYWMLHQDETYKEHPINGQLNSAQVRGTGCEIRVQGCDPDRAVEKARGFGFQVIEPARNKPHNLREAFLADPDGFVWVPCIFQPSSG